VKILALDSSSPVASIALVDCSTTAGENSEILFRADTPHSRSDSSALFEGLQAAVATGPPPDALCVGLGPGSYNGLRAGIAAGRAFATALEIPLLALPSPLALPGSDSGFWAVGDARGGHYWVACVKNGSFLEEPRLYSPREAALHLLTQTDFPILSSIPLPGLENLLLATPDAGRLAILAQQSPPFAGTPEPLYLKSPHITPSRPASSRT
jgi:tRNA threonylcarbamoyl adenosine modification protein YeaZ